MVWNSVDQEMSPADSCGPASRNQGTDAPRPPDESHETKAGPSMLRKAGPIDFSMCLQETVPHPLYFHRRSLNHFV